MGMKEQIQEAAEKIGRDSQEAINLHKSLCQSQEPGAQFAAEHVRHAMSLYFEADRVMSLLAVLANAESQTQPTE